MSSAFVWSQPFVPVSKYQVPLLLTGVRLHPPGRTDKNLCRCFGAPATHVRRPHGRVFPDHLISKEGRLHCLDDFEQSNNTAMLVPNTYYLLTYCRVFPDHLIIT